MGDIQDRVAAGVLGGADLQIPGSPRGGNGFPGKAVGGFLPEWSLALWRGQVLFPVCVASCQRQRLTIKQTQFPGA